MANRHSFKDIAEERYYNELFDALNTYVEEDPGKLERSTYFVQS